MNLAKTVVTHLLLILSFFSGSGMVKADKLAEFRREFEAMPKEQQTDYSSLKQKAFSEYSKEKYLTALVAIFDAQHIFNKDIDLIFLKGVCYAHFSDIEQAESCYTQVLEVSPEHLLALVNITEINFYSGNHNKSMQFIERINKVIKDPVNAERLPLLHFKYLISLVKLSQKEPAKYRHAIKKMNRLYHFMDDSPYYYFAKALELLERKEKQQAYEWLLRAYRVFNDPNLIESWNKPLIEAGYLNAHEFMFVRRKK